MDPSGIRVQRFGARAKNFFEVGGVTDLLIFFLEIIGPSALGSLQAQI